MVSKRRKKSSKKLKKDMFKQKHCSLKDSTKNISCLDNKLLIKIGNILNTYHDAEIKLVEDRKILHDKISEKVTNMSECNSEKCWLTINELIKQGLKVNCNHIFLESFDFIKDNLFLFSCGS